MKRIKVEIKTVQKLTLASNESNTSTYYYLTTVH